MTVPEIKKYLGGHVRVRKLTRKRLGNMLKSIAHIDATILIPTDCNHAPYAAFLNDATGHLFAVLADEKLVNEKRLGSLLNDVESCRKELQENQSKVQGQFWTK